MTPQVRPSCPDCGRWRRVDHRCPGPAPKPKVQVASTKRLPKLVHP